MRCELLDDKGKGRAVVYVPGIDGSGELLLRTAERLQQRFRLLRMQHVANDGAADDSYEGLARGIANTLDRLGIDDALLLAESFGGAVALQCALDAPTRVRALAIVNSFAWFPKRLSLAGSRLGAPLLPQWLFRKVRPHIAPFSLFGPLGKTERDALRRFAELRGIAPDRAYRRRLKMIQGLDLRPRLHEIRQPVALFAADRDRIVPSVACAQTMTQGIPHATTEVVRGGGHLILPLESLPWADWLEALDERGD